jgi:hypothetical protein
MAVSLAAQDAPVISDALLADVLEIETLVSGTRGITPLIPVDRRFPSSEEVQTFLRNSIDEQLTPEYERQAESFYVAFGFIEPTLDLKETFLALLQDQVAGYYDPDSKTMNTILISDGELGDELPALEKIIYAHEFVHALQDQRFDLNSLGYDVDPAEAEADVLLAVQALVEGDATFVMNLYTQALIEANPMAAFGILSSSLASGGGTLPANTPDILSAELLFPYTTGLSFVTDLIASGDYAVVDAAFSNLPQSTEQVLHPEKYLAGEAPIVVTLTLPENLLGGGWTFVDEATFGEFYLQQFLGLQLSRTEANSAAAGWGGDRFVIYSDASGQHALALEIAWDTDADQQEFHAAMQTWATEGNYPLMPPASAYCYDTVNIAAGRYLCINLRVAGTPTRISRAPDVEQALTLLQR